MDDALHIAVYVLAGVAAIEAGALVVLWRLLTRSRQEVEELRQPGRRPRPAAVRRPRGRQNRCGRPPT